MKINIWSDIRCPFCFIGKRKFEAALEKFPYKEKVEVIWRSFELDPMLKTRTDITMYEFLADLKGMAPEQAEQMHHQVTQIAEEVGLEFNMEVAVVANSFDAHRLIQLAKSKGLGAEAEEELFKAHFTEGKNIDDKETLTQLGVSIGLKEEEVSAMLSSQTYAEDVRKDESMAQAIGVRGVPFFGFDDKYAVSGAQSTETFLQTLEKSWEEFEGNGENKEG